MDLTPQDKDKLLLFTAGLLAERRKERGIKLNYPEAMAYLSCAMLEGAREGRDPEELVVACRLLLKSADVMDGVAEMLNEVTVEATFPDGVRLICVPDPINNESD
ncbi:Urease subunit gamma [Thiorhodovibrio winogradskyi]|uniref:Urease subunit gamma n=1 Tax=Thiorhodovibrio winogradskyi TaxID=77007 RepID=A0ABZ0SCS9_9GAMM|nr:urease subunit gamma [Thiorhodovibrio winogradskyi]